MTTETFTPHDGPPPRDAPVPSDPRPPGRSTGWVALLVTLVGAVVVLGLVLQSVVVGIGSSGRSDQASYTSDVDGVTSLDVDISSAELSIRFDAVDEASLEVRSTGWRRNLTWLLENEGGVLRVADERDLWFWPSFGGARTTAELVLPAALEGEIDADLDLSAGSLRLEGDLQAVGIEVSAGNLTFTGASTALAVDVNAGEATVETEGPESVTVDLSAGRFTGTVTGAPPRTTTVEVSAGSVRLELPDGEYSLGGQVAAGDRTIDVRTNPTADHALTVDVRAGDAWVGYSR